MSGSRLTWTVQAQGQGRTGNLKRALLDGAMVVLPIGAVVLLVLGIVHRLEWAVDPLAGRFVHPAIVAIVALVVFCIVVGLLVRSAVGRGTRRALETRLFEKLPGYCLAKVFAGTDRPPRARSADATGAGCHREWRVSGAG